MAMYYPVGGKGFKKRLILFPKTISSSKIAFAQFAAAICCGIQVRNSGHYSNLQKNSKVRVTAIVSGSSFCFVFNHL